MPDRLGCLLTEVDRQLEEMREQGTALAARAGVAIGAAAISAAVLTARAQYVSGTEMAVIVVLLIIATLSAIFALSPTFVLGPTSMRIQQWRTLSDETQAIDELLDAKLVLVGANRARLLVMTCAFYAEGVAVAAAVIAMIVAVAGK